jgi:nucleoside-diphosphate-sugar epimerase
MGFLGMTSGADGRFCNEPIGVLGASSFVGERVFELASTEGLRVIPLSRTPLKHGPEWRGISAGELFRSPGIERWISLCPVNALAGLLPMLELAGVRRLVAVSSTSVVTKKNSTDFSERALAESLRRSEERIRHWASRTGVEVVLLRTTLTYDGVRDRNIAEMARFIRRWRVLPVMPPSIGLRQPLHAGDLARICVSAVRSGAPQGSYHLSGGETLTYLEMAGRVFDAIGLPRRFLPLPPIVVWCPGAVGEILPRGQTFPVAMFERMNADLVFDHESAVGDLGFRPRGFRPNVDFRLESPQPNE